MKLTLTELEDAMAERFARTVGVSREEAANDVRIEIEEARAAYRAAGAPFGDDDAGLVRYLTTMPPDTA
jgi:hypothetical protein